MALFGSCRTKRGIETVRIHELFPRDRFVEVREIEVPRRISVQLARIGKPRIFLARQNLEKLGLAIPEPFLDEPFEFCSLDAKSLRDSTLSRQPRNFANRHSVAVHVAV